MIEILKNMKNLIPKIPRNSLIYEIKFSNGIEFDGVNDSIELNIIVKAHEGNNIDTPPNCL
jgi:hypothetical protein